MKIGIFVQARLESTRFPKKVLKKIGKFTILEIIFKRISRIKSIKKNSIFLLTTNKNSDLALVTHVKNMGFKSYRGSSEDVLDRFYQAAKKFKVKNIVRITGDCPLIDCKVVSQLIKLHLIFFIR